MHRQAENTVQSCYVCQSAEKSARLGWLSESCYLSKRALEKIDNGHCWTTKHVISPKLFITLVYYDTNWPKVCFLNVVTLQAAMNILRAVFSREGYLTTDPSKPELFKNFLEERKRQRVR